MTAVVAQAAATGADLRSEPALEQIAQGFLRWYRDEPPDVGNQTRWVLSRAARLPGPAAPELRRLSRELHEQTGRTAGNGSLMRTAPGALAHLGDPLAIAEAARAVSALTHHDPLAGDACVLWCLAIDHAVRTGTLDLHVGLPAVDDAWAGWLDEAEEHAPAAFGPGGGRAPNGFVVTTLQAAASVCSRAGSLEDGAAAGRRRRR